MANSNADEGLGGTKKKSHLKEQDNSRQGHCGKLDKVCVPCIQTFKFTLKTNTVLTKQNTSQK